MKSFKAIVKKYLLIWLVTGAVSEMLSGENALILRVIINPYSYAYLGYGETREGYMIMFVMMHTARLLWLMTASLFEYWSQKFKPAKYVAWLMLCLYFAPSVLFLFA